MTPATNCSAKGCTNERTNYHEGYCHLHRGMAAPQGDKAHPAFNEDYDEMLMKAGGEAITSLLARISELEKDARRWRAVRDRHAVALNRVAKYGRHGYSRDTSDAVLDKWADDAADEIESLTGKK